MRLKYYRPMPFHNKLLRWTTYLLGLLFFLVVSYGIGRLIHVAQGSIYHGERAPYLQMASANGMTLRWQSSIAYRGVVKYGLTEENLTGLSLESESREGHEVRLTGLKPATRYYYRAGSHDGKFTAGGLNRFVTSPLTGTEQAGRFVVLGDPGVAIPGQAKVRDATLQWLRENKRPNRAIMDALLSTGDNAYSSGKNEEFQYQFFEPYKAILAQFPVWPVYGNHDARRWSFFEIFSFPTQAESGGVASGTEHYYSFDYGQIHFVILDSQASRRNVDGEMANWLRQDLKANQQPWLISLFHHPPYTKGSHNSDSHYDSRGRMFDMRENILPILERSGVDLVLSGHSHMYERSYLADCHYGTSDSLQTSMILSRHRQHYQKRSVGGGEHEGTIYAVIGSSARADHGPINHPLMASSMMETGALVIDVQGNRLDGRFISGEGLVVDHFSITKGVAEAAVGVCGQ